MDIKHYNGHILFSDPNASTIAQTLTNAVKAGTDLRGAILSDADLSGADLSGADLSGANLRSANLRSANLSGANLQSANLQSANLQSANLRGANLSGAILSGADLRSADLSGAYLSDADLTNTVLDPAREIIVMDPVWLTSKGLECKDEWVYGYRTKTSRVVGSTVYEVRPEPYKAPVFSTCATTDCHPGIYLAPMAWLVDNYPGPYIKVRCLRSELLKAGDKYRAKRIWVMEDVA